MPTMDSTEIVVANDLAEIERLKQFIEAFCKRHDVPPAMTFHFQLACDEAVTNIISYGYDGDDAKHAINLRMWIEDHAVSAEIKDGAKPYDPLTQAPIPDLDADMEDRPIGGLGVHFIKTFMDTAHYHRIGGLNCLSFSKKMP